MAADDLIRDPRVFRYALELARAKDGLHAGRLRPSVFLDVLMFPKVSRKSPEYWQVYVDNWKRFHGLDVQRGLSAVAAAAVLHVIGGALAEDADNQSAVCFITEATIAKRAHVSRRTVVRALHGWQKDSPVPLIEMSKPGRTKGIHHKCFRFTLIENPLVYAAKRDAVRADKVATANVIAATIADDLQPRRLALQKALVLGQMTQADYQAAIDALEQEIDRAARGTLPRSVKLRQRGTQRGKHPIRLAVNQ